MKTKKALNNSRSLHDYFEVLEKLSQKNRILFYGIIFIWFIVLIPLGFIIFLLIVAAAQNFSNSEELFTVKTKITVFIVSCSLGVLLIYPFVYSINRLMILNNLQFNKYRALKNLKIHYYLTFKKYEVNQITRLLELKNIASNELKVIKHFDQKSEISKLNNHLITTLNKFNKNNLSVQNDFDDIEFWLSKNHFLTNKKCENAIKYLLISRSFKKIFQKDAQEFSITNQEQLLVLSTYLETHKPDNEANLWVYKTLSHLRNNAEFNKFLNDINSVSGNISWLFEMETKKIIFLEYTDERLRIKIDKDLLNDYKNKILSNCKNKWILNCINNFDKQMTQENGYVDHKSLILLELAKRSYANK
ncbi:hypothetical protein [Mycoplasmopsis alligatoris]|uniref:hypothetical protein n=1 Tax=Mycoplasmopsis alligatoris TaxID=47687 RepID=UPI0002FCFA21|nr:hypothetical protein [Mycoplasmopsis alligatoris]